MSSSVLSQTQLQSVDVKLLKFTSDQSPSQMSIEELVQEYETVCQSLSVVKTQKAAERTELLKSTVNEIRVDRTKALGFFLKNLNLPKEEAFSKLGVYVTLLSEDEEDKNALRELENKLKKTSEDNPEANLMEVGQRILQQEENELKETIQKLQEKEVARKKISREIQLLNDKLKAKKGDKVGTKQKIAKLQKSREPLNNEIDAIASSKKKLEFHLIEIRRDLSLACHNVKSWSTSESPLRTIQKQMELISKRIAERQMKKEELQKTFKMNFMVNKTSDEETVLTEKLKTLQNAITNFPAYT